MTLKEKFGKIEIKLGENDTTYLVLSEAKECEKIAEDFAIGFASYLDGYWEVTIKRSKTIKELLEIYKKEKGL